MRERERETEAFADSVSGSFLQPYDVVHPSISFFFNPLNVDLNPICHLMALLGAHHILHFSRIRVKFHFNIILPSI
jgi:transposase